MRDNVEGSDGSVYLPINIPGLLVYRVLLGGVCHQELSRLALNLNNNKYSALSLL